jgi:FkbH-like protein
MAPEFVNGRNEELIKCVIWDLDNTLWDGVLLESDSVRLKPNIAAVLATLDERGILHSIASKNEPEPVFRKLSEFGLEDYFLCPQISWNAKSISVAAIREQLNLGFQSLLFIDDEPVERGEVQSEHPEVWCLEAGQYLSLPDHPRLRPRFVTDDSRQRRHMYQAQMQRQKDEQDFQGPKKAFLKSLDLRFTIARATEADLERAEELTLRTNQLNATGRTYSYDELRAFLVSPSHELLICSLEDRFGSYGKVGLALVENSATCFHIRLFLFSCRVTSLGVGSVLLTYVLRRAKEMNKPVRADFVPTDRNRMARVAFRLANFGETGPAKDGVLVLENRLEQTPSYPSYVKIVFPETIE